MVVGLCLLAAAAPLLWSHPFVLHIATQALIWALLAASWDVLSGYTGQVSFGHAGFFSIGAYVAAIATQRFGVPSYAAMPLAALITASAGLLVGFPALRLRGHYLALVTLGFGEIVALVAQNWEAVTGGPFGLHDFGSFGLLPAAALARQQVSYLIVLGVTVTVLLGLLWLCNRTDAGPAFRAIREDQVLAASLGINTTRYKLLAFTIAAAGAGAAGSLYAFYIQLVSPAVGSAANSAIVIAMAVFGGVGTIWGPFLGGILLYGLTEMLRFVGVVYNLIAVGLIMIIFVIYAPKGLAGLRLPSRRREVRADARAPRT
ncbi:MAG: branched-chain amino acid ABC transporter permease [Acetobacteraceae bacterium]